MAPGAILTVAKMLMVNAVISIADIMNRQNFNHSSHTSVRRMPSCHIFILHTYMHAYMHACMHAYIHTYIHTYIHIMIYIL